jgi:hypothetical protein
MLRANLVAPRDVFAPLPEEVLTDLHERLDRGELQNSPVRTLVLQRFEAALIERLFPFKDERRILVRLRLHSHVTAIAATVIASHTNLPVQSAFVCGWLHDMGIASCIHHLDDGSVFRDKATSDKLWKLIIDSAPRHTIHLASRWRLPSSVRYALRDHVGFDAAAPPGELACVMFVAEHIAAMQGCGFRDEQPATGLRPRLLSIGLTERDLLPLARHTEQRIGHLELEWRSLSLLGED